MFAYCGNNPVTGYDPTGCWDWGLITDVVITLLTGIPDVGAGVGVTATTASIAFGILPASTTFGLANNLIDAVYYTFISDGVSNLDTDPEKSSYVDRYVSRWDRLDHAKAQTKDSWYTFNAWRYYGEYSFHMYGWYMTGWADGQNIPVISEWASSFKDAAVNPTENDSRDIVAFASLLCGILGI